MPVPESPGAWWGSLLWLVGLGATAFVVAWLTGTRLRIRRTAYIPILFAVTAALTVGYIRWLDLGLGDALTARWGWGIVGGVVVGVVLIPAIRKQPVDRHLDRSQLPVTLAWEGVVYGVAEGTLLSGLPAFMTWQLVDALDWSGAGGAVARWTLPVAAGAAVIVVHHLGYWSCRNRILIPITLACSLLTVSAIVTGSLVAPMVAHVLMHIGADLHGVEMPPVERPITTTAPRAERESHLEAA